MAQITHLPEPSTHTPEHPAAPHLDAIDAVEDYLCSALHQTRSERIAADLVEALFLLDGIALDLTSGEDEDSEEEHRAADVLPFTKF